MGQESIKVHGNSGCGGHNIILIGPPGAGKTMLASGQYFATYDFAALETTKIHSGRKTERSRVNESTSFRSPHHTISNVALVGGGVTHNQVKFRWRIMFCF
jgi:magnesium chelatase family protein